MPGFRTIHINGEQQYLWRAVDQDSEVVVVYLQSRWDGTVARRFFKRLILGHGDEPRKIAAYKLRSYGFAHREPISEAIDSAKQYESGRAEQVPVASKNFGVFL